MLRDIIFGLFKGALSIFLVINVIFFIFQVIPSDPARVIAGEGATEEQIQKIRKELGLDLPVSQRYKNTILSLLKLDFGKSMIRNIEVKKILLPRLRNTFDLAVFTILLVIVESLLLSFLFLRFRKLEDFLVAFSTFLYSIPNFWLGVLLIIMFSVKAKLFPMSGYESVKNLFLPGITLSISLSVVLSRFIRNSIEQVLDSDFSRFLKAKGVYGFRFFLHVAKAVLPTIITVLGLQAGVLLSGVVVTETVFSFPGVGTFIVESALSRDFPAVISSVFVIASIWVLVNLSVDIFVKISDPRLRG